MTDKKRLIWKETGPAIEYDGRLLYIEDLNPHVTHEDICNTREGGPCNCDWSAASSNQNNPLT